MSIDTMNPEYSYVCEKFSFIMKALNSGPGPVQRRLYNAYIGHLMVLQSDDFPEQLQPLFESIMEALTWLPHEHSQDGKVEATLRHMNDEGREPGQKDT